MTQAKTGDTVRIHYIGTLKDGSQFDSSVGRDPLQFQLGAGQIIPGLDREIDGMNLGDKQRVEVPAGEAYGPHDPQKVQQVPRNVIPENIELQPGMQLQAQTQNGVPLTVVVTEIQPESVTLDGNHPLAGQDLVFDVELIEIVQAA
ncbi:FKBP-type peptidyl-prolyl cis-trans isomerase [Rhizobium halophytocola]|uniref:Peptidyl-prolyl cis-trans isomerase n=1 Tax=Rhizobium halophytocola TaxID=735519 RepID=A0ABS4E0P1_9HYPH|nr:peptidylprolyl isomerase [Rhizobium halophytocola]MBP1851501.1 peptidylprolyl isomerase [Rhizobium halophytocola]